MVQLGGLDCLLGLCRATVVATELPTSLQLPSVLTEYYNRAEAARLQATFLPAVFGYSWTAIATATGDAGTELAEEEQQQEHVGPE